MTELLTDSCGQPITEKDLETEWMGEKAIVDYKEGKIDGLLRLYYPNGSLHKSLTYKEGILEGPFTFFYEDGSVKVKGAHKNGKPHGKMFEYEGIQTMEYTYENGSLNGPFKRFLAGRLADTGFYKDGKMDGEGISYDPNTGALLVHCFYKDGKYHGPYRRYTSSGELYETGIYKNGVLHGPFIGITPWGRVDIGTYQDGNFIRGEEAYQSAVGALPTTTDSQKELRTKMQDVYQRYLKIRD